MQTSTTQNQTYNLEQWKQGYRSQKQEFDYQITDITGEIPHDLTGTLFRNGPGLLDINDVSVRHPFDGDGMICRISFKDGKAHFLNRYVRTEAYLAEQAAGGFLYRGVFGTQKAGGWLSNAFDLKLKNIANTQVVYWGGKLLAHNVTAVFHHDNKRCGFAFGNEVIHNHGGAALIAPTCFVFARAMLQIEHGKTLFRFSIILRRGVNVTATNRVAAFGEVTHFAQLSMRHVFEGVEILVFCGNFNAASPAFLPSSIHRSAFVLDQTAASRKEPGILGGAR